MKLSAVVITKNEAKNIGDCLASLDFCDEVVVVDAESSDDTREIATRYNANVIVRPWNGYGEQKNFGLSQTKNRWVLSLDADERVSPELREELLGLEDSEQSPGAYYIPRKTIHCGRWIRYGGWYPNYLLRLFDKEKGSWSLSEVHEEWLTQTKKSHLNGDLIHYSFYDLFDQVDRNNHYSTLAAKHLKAKGKRFSLFSLCTKPVTKFVELYFLKRGFLDGYPGFIIAVSASYSVFLKWAKLWELQRE